MGIKVAIASSDGINIDLGFGQAKEYLIYQLNGDRFEFLEKRPAPENIQVEGIGPACGGGNSLGCGGGGMACGGCGGGASGPLSPAVEKLSDCRSIVAAQIGQNVRRQFERHAVSVFDIELPVDEALEKLASYYLKFE